METFATVKWSVTENKASVIWGKLGLRLLLCSLFKSSISFCLTRQYLMRERHSRICVFQVGKSDGFSRRFRYCSAPGATAHLLGQRGFLAQAGQRVSHCHTRTEQVGGEAGWSHWLRTQGCMAGALAVTHTHCNCYREMCAFNHI